MIVGALWFRLGLLSIRILCFLKSDKNDGVMAPKAGLVNDPNLTINLPNFNRDKLHLISKGEVKCLSNVGLAAKKNVKSTLKRSYLSSSFFESVLHLNR